MLIGGILLGLALGLLAGGSLTNLASIRLRWLGLLLGAIVLRFSTDFLLNADVRHRRGAATSAARDGLRDAARRAVGEPGVPGPGARVRGGPVEHRRDRHQRRLHAHLRAESDRRRVHPSGRLVGDPRDPARRPERLLPAPPGPIRRRDPDPGADHPERHLDRRRVPERRARVLPVRQRRADAAGTRRGDRGGHPAPRRPDRGRRSCRPWRRDRLLGGLHRHRRPGTADHAGRVETGAVIAVTRADGRVRRGRRRPAPSGHRRRATASASTPTSGWPSTGRSRRCGPAS